MAMFDDIYDGLNKNIIQTMEDEDLSLDIKKEIDALNKVDKNDEDVEKIIHLLKYTTKMIKKGKVDIQNCKINITIRDNDGSIILKGSNKRYRRRFR